MFLPGDVCERHALDLETVFQGETTSQLKAVLREMRDHARHHLKRVRGEASNVPESCGNAFLPLVLVEPYLKRLEKEALDPLKQIVELSQLKAQWLLWRGSRRPLTRL